MYGNFFLHKAANLRGHLMFHVMQYHKNISGHGNTSAITVAVHMNTL